MTKASLHRRTDQRAQNGCEEWSFWAPDPWNQSKGPEYQQTHTQPPTQGNVNTKQSKISTHRDGMPPENHDEKADGRSCPLWGYTTTCVLGTLIREATFLTAAVTDDSNQRIARRFATRTLATGMSGHCLVARPSWPTTHVKLPAQGEEGGGIHSGGAVAGAKRKTTRRKTGHTEPTEHNNANLGQVARTKTKHVTHGDCRSLHTAFHYSSPSCNTTTEPDFTHVGCKTGVSRTPFGWR
jgi:hypothetical protein